MFIPYKFLPISIKHFIFVRLFETHFVMYIFSFLPCILKATSVENPVLPLSLHPLVSLMVQDSIDLLLDAVRTSNEDLAQTWKKSEQWATIEQLCSKSSRLLGNTYQIPKGRMAHQRPLLPSRYGWRPALQLSGLRRHGRPLRARLLVGHVVLPSLHLHEPAGHGAL